MENKSEIVFVLQGLNDSLTNRHIYFAFSLISYFITVFINLMLIVTICMEPTLHEPIYIFVCNLCFNGICGASSFYPKLLHDLLVDSYIITYTGCFTQIFVVYCYVFCDFTSLTIMAFDRYLAICKPLQYSTLMKVQRVVQLLFPTWCFSLMETFVGILLTTRLTICSHHVCKIFCTSSEVVKLSCSDTASINIYSFVLTFLHFSQTGLILVSYTHLVRTSLQSRSSRRKFVQTCLPHLVTLLVFTVSLLFDTMYSRYSGSGINLRQIRCRIVHNFTHKSAMSRPS